MFDNHRRVGQVVDTWRRQKTNRLVGGQPSRARDGKATALANHGFVDQGQTIGRALGPLEDSGLYFGPRRAGGRNLVVSVEWAVELGLLRLVNCISSLSLSKLLAARLLQRVVRRHGILCISQRAEQ